MIDCGRIADKVVSAICEPWISRRRKNLLVSRLDEELSKTLTGVKDYVRSMELHAIDAERVATQARAYKAEIDRLTAEVEHYKAVADELTAAKRRDEAIWRLVGIKPSGAASARFATYGRFVN